MTTMKGVREGDFGFGESEKKDREDRAFGEDLRRWRKLRKKMEKIVEFNFWFN